MKNQISSLFIAVALVLFSSTVFSQVHTLQVDDGLGHFSIIKGSSTGGIYTLGIGGGTILTTGSSLSNNTDNPIAQDNQGLGTNGVNWETNFTGFTATFSNLSAANNADGIQIAVASNAGNGRALDITTGTNFNPTGGGGVRNEVFTVMNNGNVSYSGGMVRGYLDIADASSPAAPLAASVYRINSNGANATRATITLPAGAANGSSVVLATNDPDGGQELTTGYAFSNTVSVRFIKFSDGWRPEF